MIRCIFDKIVFNVIGERNRMMLYNVSRNNKYKRTIFKLILKIKI